MAVSNWVWWVVGFAGAILLGGLLVGLFVRVRHTPKKFDVRTAMEQTERTRKLSADSLARAEEDALKLVNERDKPEFNLFRKARMTRKQR